jgi:sortase A
MQIYRHVEATAAINEFRREITPRAPLVRVSERVTRTAGEDSSIDTSLWSDKRIRAYKESLAHPFGRPLAILEIPKIHLEVPVFDGTDDVTLDRGVGRILGTARPGGEGNLGIAGHRDGYFRGLKDITQGDEIKLVLPEGERKYVVDEITVVRPDDVSILKPRPVSSITLVTCFPFYFVGSAPERYIVSASLQQIHPQP